MWGWISRADDLSKIVREINSIKELQSLRKFLSDSSNTMNLRDSTVNRALQEISKKINDMPVDEKIKAILELLL